MVPGFLAQARGMWMMSGGPRSRLGTTLTVTEAPAKAQQETRRAVRPLGARGQANLSPA